MLNAGLFKLYGHKMRTHVRIILSFIIIWTSHTIAASAYVGGEAGIVQYRDACGVQTTRCDEEKVGYGAYGGYQVNDWLALETGIRNYGTPNATYKDNHVSANLWGIDGSMLLEYQLSDAMLAFSRVGVQRLYIDKRVGDENITDTQWRPLLGLGVDYALTERWHVRSEYRFLDGVGTGITSQADLHMLMFGVTYSFSLDGFDSKRNVQVDTPVVASTSILPPTSLILHADTAFDFDSAMLQPSAIAALHPIVSRVLTTPDTVISVTGHTDDRGSEIYNQRLSERRAFAVSDYFISQGLIPPRITIKAYGETQPIADNRSALGQEKNRRVEVVVSNMFNY